MSRFRRIGGSIFRMSNFNYPNIILGRPGIKIISCGLHCTQWVLKSTKQGNKSRLVCARETKTDNSTNGSFEKMIEMRRSEARRSILVQVHSQQSCFELHEYCIQFAAIKGMHHYKLPGHLHFVVVEFAKEVDMENIMRTCSHVNSHQIIPVRSPLLWFRACEKDHGTKTTEAKAGRNIPLVVADGNNSITQSELKNLLLTCESISDQMMVLYRSSCLDDLGSRLRFLTARQLELALSGPFPLVRVLPFGSSVNGFGKMGCDLDLVLQLDCEQPKENPEARLVFQAKPALANGRTQTQRHMEAVGDVCQLFLPGCNKVKRILGARVPIIKFRHELAGLDCDLSMTNMTAVHMSELLYILGSSDDRVRPLVFAIRMWARQVGLTNPTPGRWITNFSLTLLVLFFLQQQSVIPSVNTMVTLAGAEDTRLTENGVNCTFIRNTDKLRKFLSQKMNTDSLEELLFKFFEFYAGFDFSSHAISLPEGSVKPKAEHASLYITNPLEQCLNVSKNVSHEETERLRIELRNAAWTLESVDRKPGKSSNVWGLITLLEASQFPSKAHSLMSAPKEPFSTRLMEVSELFEPEQQSAEPTSKPPHTLKLGSRQRR